MRLLPRRRAIVLGLAALPLAARAQQPAKLPTIGYLGATTPAIGGARAAAFVQRWRELGWIEGRTIAIEYRWAEGRGERYTEIALYVCADPLVVTHQVRINTLALAARLPTMHGLREHVETGGLMSYGPNFPDLFRRAGDLVDKILRGAKPADIPVEQPTKFDLVINLITAKALGLTIPESFLLRADEVIE